MREDAEGNIIQSEIVRMLKQDKEDKRKRVQFLVETKNGNDTAEEVIDYNELCNLVEKKLMPSRTTSLEVSVCLTVSWPTKDR
jgi:DNA topoisomerase IA